MSKQIEILDITLRDGSYIIDFQFTVEDTALIASALESADIGAARAGKGDQASADGAYLQAAASVLKKARLGTFFIPGIGTGNTRIVGTFYDGDYPVPQSDGEHPPQQCGPLSPWLEHSKTTNPTPKTR